MQQGQSYRGLAGALGHGRATCQHNALYCVIIGRPGHGRYFWPLSNVCANVRTLFFSIAACLASLVPAQDNPLAELAACVQQIAEGRSDNAKDSASASLKRQLGAILLSDSGMVARFGALPISRMEPADGSFRLFTWNVPLSDGSFRYEGLLLTATPRAHKLYELRDMTGKIARPAMVQLSPENWYGAVYYEMVPVKRGQRTYYTLLGWKGHSTTETYKVIDVLTITPSGPKFGAPLFTGEKQRRQRVVHGYTAQAKMLLRWEPAHKAIVLDHLSPTRPEFAGQAAFMAPDLSYDSFTWDKDHWRYDRDIDVRSPEKGKPYKAPPKEAR